MIERLCIVGVGLIGGSLARALRRQNMCRSVIGCSRRETHLRRALELGVIDEFNTDIAAAVEGADMVVVCTPMRAMVDIFQCIKPVLSAGAVLTDAGSVKQTVVVAAEQAFGEVPSFLVPAHPIAGTEHSGVDASFASLYEGRRVIVTPTEFTDPHAVDRVTRMWEATGASVDHMEPAHHDEVLAATSHLPHMLAYTLVEMLGQMQASGEIFRYAAGGFRDFSRIASSDPQMWHDICLDNKDAVVAMIKRYRDELGSLLDSVSAADGEELFERFARAKATRDKYTGEKLS